ncbi:MAG: MMPL family transporter, partial [Acidobacteriota bacterium]
MLGALAAAVVDRAVRRPRATLVAVAVVVLVAGLGALRSEIRTDGRALVPQNDPVVRFDDEVRRHFGLRAPIVVILTSEHPEGLFNLGTLRRVRAISSALQALDGIEPRQITSLATEIGDRVVPNSTLKFRPLVDAPLESAADVLRVRRDLDGIATLDGTLVSHDRRSTAILVGVPLDPTVDRRALVRRIVDTVEPLVDDDHLDVVGAPVAEALLGDHLVRDLVVLLPVVLLVVAVVLYLGCRRFWGVALGMAEVGAAQLFTFGIMGWTGAPIYLTTAVLPVILVTLGLADEIHVFWRHQQNLARPDGPRSVDAVRETMGQMVPPLMATTATTGLGFLSFLASPLAAVRGFGLFAALGILFCLAFTLTAVPAGLALLGDDKLRRPTRASGPGEPDGGSPTMAPIV